MKKTYYRAQGKNFHVMNVVSQNQSFFLSWSFWSFILKLILIIGFGYLAYWAYGKYYIVKLNIAQTYSEHYLFSLLNLTALSSFTIACVNSDGLSNKNLKIVFVICLIVIAVLGIERVGLYIWINTNILSPNNFTTNGPESIEFMFGNLHFITIIYATSFLAESNK